MLRNDELGSSHDLHTNTHPPNMEDPSLVENQRSPLKGDNSSNQVIDGATL